MSAAQTIFGFHAVISRMRAHPGSVRELYIAEGRHDPRMKDVLRLATEKNLRVMTVNTTRLDGMSAGQGKSARHQGVVAVVDALKLPQFIEDVLDTLAVPALLLILDGVQDPHNLGACLRVADAAGAHAVLAPKDRSVGLTAAAIKVASGAADTVPYIPVTNLARTLRELKERQIWVVGADAGGDSDLFRAKLEGAVAWVIGAEGEGLRRLTRENCDEIAAIPMFGSVASLNVSVAAGICLFETRRQREHATKKP
jgi:23S rRNA (guanosine2251-2'-O)-methyltransferase